MRERVKQIMGWWEKQGFGERILVVLSVVVFFVFVTYLYFAFQEHGFLKAINKGGTRNLILLLAGVVGWYFLLRRTKVAEQSVTIEQLTRAMDQLASDRMPLRLGGILGLEQIAGSQTEERRKIARILASFIRERDEKYPSKEPELKYESDASNKKALIAYRIQRLDMEAAVNALAHIAAGLEYRNQYNEFKYHLCDLQDCDLRGLRFVEADLSGFNFKNSQLAGAWLRQADLSGALLKGADFQYAYLSGTNLKGVEGWDREQLVDAFADEELPPRNLPDGLKPPRPEEGNPDMTK